MSSTPQNRRPHGIPSGGQFDFVQYAETEVHLGSPPVAGVLDDDELLRRDREVAQRHLSQGEEYNEHPASTLREVYGEELNRLRGWRESSEPRYTSVEMQSHWERKEMELNYLNGVIDELQS